MLPPPALAFASRGTIASYSRRSIGWLAIHLSCTVCIPVYTILQMIVYMPAQRNTRDFIWIG